MACVGAGEWSAQRALRVAEQLVDPEARAKAFTGLARRLAGELRRQILHQSLAAAAIGKEWHRAQALAAVAGQLGG